MNQSSPDRFEAMFSVGDRFRILQPVCVRTPSTICWVNRDWELQVIKVKTNGEYDCIASLSSHWCEHQNSPKLRFIKVYMEERELEQELLFELLPDEEDPPTQSVATPSEPAQKCMPSCCSGSATCVIL